MSSKPPLKTPKAMGEERPDFLHPIGYSIIKRPLFRYRFPGLDEIQINHSQLHQDMFVLTALNGKQRGWYLEIGANEPICLSNTYLLEKSFGWSGIGLEINPEMVARHGRQRRNPCVAIDATTADYESLLEEHAFPGIIDYLSIDIDPPQFTLAALRKIPHEKYRFRIITFEHDYSAGGEKEREESRKFLAGLGYELLINDESWMDYIVEDWWIHPDLVEASTASMLKRRPEPYHCHDQIFYDHHQRQPVQASQEEKADSLIHAKSEQASKCDLCIEGWRLLNHSYSLVNQWQLLALLAHPLEIRHRDIAPFINTWNELDNGSGLHPNQQQQIAAISPPSANETFKATYRISFPFDFSPAAEGRLFVFATTEYGLSPEMIKGASLDSAIHDDNLQIITPSQWSKQGFLLSGFEAEKIHVIPHAAAPEAFYRVGDNLRSLYRQIFGFNEEDRILLNLGALTTNKGVDLLLSAYARLKPYQPHLKLVIKNQSNLYERKITNVFAEMIGQGRGPIPSADAMADIIVIDENLDIDTLRALYNACDAYVSPYRAEGFNLPALEAAACGLPILVTAGGSSDDYFSPQLGLKIASEQFSWQGMRVLNPSLDSLIDGIEQVLAKPQAWGGGQGSRWVHDHFNWQGVGEHLLRVMNLG